MVTPTTCPRMYCIGKQAQARRCSEPSACGEDDAEDLRPDEE